MASMNPPAIGRFLTSLMMRRMTSSSRLLKKREQIERKRRKSGLRHKVEYFHQVDDGYSHLAAQLLQRLHERYDIDLVCHLSTVRGEGNLPEPELLVDLSRHDAQSVAPYYGLTFPENTGAPEPQHVETGSRILAAAAPQQFAQVAVAVGDAVFAGDLAALEALGERHGMLSLEETKAKIAQGNARRDALKHYSTAMFYCGDEWYWGADRIYHLEKRLIEQGACRDNEAALICPRPPIEAGPLKDNGTLTLEFYPSLRSPYTSFIFDETVRFAESVGVKLAMRPVLPMVMRGVSLTMQKGIYITMDSGREAHALGIEWGKAYDPIGDPVRNGYSLYPWAREQGKGNQLLSAFLHAAFFDGVNTDNDKGMKTVVENAGLSWAEAQKIMGNQDWEEEIEANRLAMYDVGLWGVPSYRLLDAQGNTVLALWGQDRLWLFAKEIQRLLRKDQ